MSKKTNLNIIEIGKLRIQKMKYVFLWKYIVVILHLLFTIYYLGLIQTQGGVLFDYNIIPLSILGFLIFLSSYFSSERMKGVWILSLISGILMIITPIVFMLLPDFNFVLYYIIINVSMALDLLQTLWFTGILFTKLPNRKKYSLELSLFAVFFGFFSYYLYGSYPSYLASFGADVWDTFDPTSLYIVLGIIGFFLGAGIVIILLLRRNAKKQGKSWSFPSWSDVGGFFGRKGSSSDKGGKYNI